MKRVEYAGSVHDEEEIEAVVAVLRGGATALRIGRNVRELERLVAERFGKQRGVMCNSGSSALYLAVELLGLAPGDEIITSAVTFSTDVAPMIRAGLVPVFVDVEPDTYQIDVAQIESAIWPRTKAILAPNLIGNCPDWDVIRTIASAISMYQAHVGALPASLSQLTSSVSNAQGQSAGPFIATVPNPPPGGAPTWTSYEAGYATTTEGRFSVSASGEPILNLPAGIKTIFIPILFLNSLGFVSTVGVSGLLSTRANANTPATTSPIIRTGVCRAFSSFWPVVVTSSKT